MNFEETNVRLRPDKQIVKKIVKSGDYSLVPYEGARCKVLISNLECKNKEGQPLPIEPECKVFSKNFSGNIMIGDSDFYLDEDFELILQQMCNGEVCDATMTYKDNNGEIAKLITCTVELLETTDEQLISDWGWMRLYEAAVHHKEKGVELVKQKRIVDAFRQFNKALKMLVAIEPIDPQEVPEESLKDMTDLKVKIYNNLAHCQLQYNEFDAALDICNRAMKFDPENVKTLYRQAVAYQGLGMFEEAWNNLQKVLKEDPTDKAAQARVSQLKPKVEQINKNYSHVIKNMFRS